MNNQQQNLEQKHVNVYQWINDDNDFDQTM